jgi:hypothetical protein
VRLERHTDPLADAVVFTLVIDAVDFARSPLDARDRLLIDECSLPTATIADRLLGLETIARRIEQTHEPETIPGQITVEEALADAGLGVQDGRCRDETTKTDAK